MNTGNASVSKGRRISGNILIGFGGAVLFASAATKLVQVPKVVEQLGALGFSGNRLTAIAILEIFSAALFLVPATRAIGLLMVSAYMGGAIAAHFGHGQMVMQPAMVLFVLWLGAWVRNPEILWSLKGTAADQSARSQNSGTILRQI
jgi:hypothetical protein